MAKHVIKSYRNTQWVVDQDGDTWILERQGKLDVPAGPAILIEAGFDDNKLVIHGDIAADIAASAAVANDGDGNVITFGRKAYVNGAEGISGGGDDTRVVNAGLLSATSVVIAQNEGFRLTNSGEINGGNYGISVAQADLITNEKDGKIIGGGTGILLFGDDHSRIVNQGRISGGDYSIFTLEGSVDIVNTGRIKGDIWLLGGGNDLLQSLKGEVIGTVRGGVGDDTYKISQSNLEIVELSGEGFDTVHSTVTFTLPDNVESLYLLGGKNADATGNASANSLIGNSGDNMLSGGDSGDTLRGRGGNDRLTGGVGADMFLFQANADKEVVTDFEDGVDRIFIHNSINSIDTWSEVDSRLEQHGADVWLTAGGTKMVIKNTDVDVLDENDFAFVVF